MLDLEAEFEKHEDQFFNWKDVETKLHLREDMHVFLLLDRLVPGDKNILGGADHDKIYFGIDLDDLAKVITEEQVLELCKCGVFFEDDSLCMFV